MKFGRHDELLGAFAAILSSLLGASLLFYLPHLSGTVERALASSGGAMLITLAPLPLLKLKLTSSRFVQLVCAECCLLLVATAIAVLAYLRLEFEIGKVIAIVAVIFCLGGVIAIVSTMFGIFADRMRISSDQEAESSQPIVQRKTYSHPWQADPRGRFVFLIFPLAMFLVTKGDISSTVLMAVIFAPLSVGYWWAFRRRSKWIMIDPDGISAESYDRVFHHARWGDIKDVEKRNPTLIWGRTELWIYHVGSQRPIIATSDMSNSRELFAALKTGRLT